MATQRAELARDVDAHLRRLGFLLVVGHRVPQTRHRRLPRAVPHVLPPSGGREGGDDPRPGGAYRGWVGPGLESNAATYGIDTPPDLKETFAYGPVDVPDAIAPRPRARSRSRRTAGRRGPPGSGRRPRRGGAPARHSPTNCSTCVRSRSPCPSRPCATAAGRRPPRCRSTGTARAATTDPEPNQFRVGPHTDFGTLTVLDREPGARRAPGPGRGRRLDRRPLRRGEPARSTPAT